MNEEQVMHAMGIDDAYHVERTLAEGRAGVTQRVTIEGSGPFVRKRIPSALANRAAWAALADCSCPRLPRVAATYEMPDCFVVVYDYIPGDTLEHIVAANGRLEPSEAVQIVRDVCEAVADLHAHGVVHCDVTPSNVIVAADGAHLIDPGIAQTMGRRPSRDAVALGTLGFAAPEQYGFAPVDARSDVYSLAHLLGYLLSGVSPEPADDSFEKALADEHVVSPALAAVVRCGSVFEPSARYQTVEAFSAAMALALGGSGSAAGGVGASFASDSCAQAGSVGGASNVATTAANAPASNAAVSHMPSTNAATDFRHAEGGEKNRVSIIAAGTLAAVAVIATIGGVVLLNMGNFARIAEGMNQPAKSSNAGTEKNADKSTDEIMTAEEIASAAAAAGVQEGFDSAMDSWGAGFASEEDVEAAYKALSIAESGWSVGPSGYVNYALALKNAEDGFQVDFPTIKIVGRNADGSILFSDEQVLSVISPGQTLYVGFQAGNGEAPETVEFELAKPNDFSVSKNAASPAVFEVKDVTAVSDGFGGTNFTGEITCLSEGEPAVWLNQVAVTIVLRNAAGEMVYGTASHIDSPAEGESTAFEVVGGKLPEYKTVEAYARL